jgi:hypothetical protein
MLAADAVVTVYGTVALEAAARGIPVICADRSYYSDWGLTHEAKSRDHYGELLASAAGLAPATEAQRRRAAACAALALGPTPPELGLIPLRCDSSGPVLYEDIIAWLDRHDPALEAERAALADWLASDTSSYAVYQRISFSFRACAGPGSQMPADRPVAGSTASATCL